MTKILLAVAVAAATVFIAVPAQACHSFTVSASPSSPAEGGYVTVTVSRESAGSPSNVHVFTTDETAHAPADYSKLDQQVYFSGDTSKSFQVAIKADSVSEGMETFRVGLDNPGGCTTSGLETGSDARVSIKGNQAAQRTQPPPLQTAPPVTGAPRVTARPAAATPSVSTTATNPSASPTASATASPFVAFPEGAQPGVQAISEDGSSMPLWPVLGLGLGAIVAGGGAWLLWYRRRVV